MKRLIIIFLPVLCFSCKKDNEKFAKQEVTGILLHNITKQPLPGQSINLSLFQNWLDKSRKSDEFPDGMPVGSVTRYSTVTDAKGKFSFQFTPTHEWNFVADVNNSEYISVVSVSNRIFSLPRNFSTYITQNFSDTVYAERPGYIRYHVQNTGLTYPADSLYLSTSGGIGYKNNGFSYGLGYFLPLRQGYDFWWAGASVNAIVYDTLAAESVNKVFTKWLHMRTDTVLYVTDSINILPHNITDYSINY